MNYKINTYGEANSGDFFIKLRCPACGQRGTFDTLLSRDLQTTLGTDQKRYGLRRCPDPDCHSLVFFVYNVGTHRVEISYPEERIDFNSTDIPAGVLKSMEEAISCHANQNFTAAAIMVRKTLEEICNDRQAKGGNLKERTEDLSTKIVVPQELVQGMDDLRLLGNDAAHIESKIYDAVGPTEVEVALEFTKEILKSLYQLSGLLAKLQNLKKGNT